MPTTKPRINITFQPETAALLKQLARRSKKSVASLAKDMVLDALERREDAALLRFAEECEKDQVGKRIYSHEEVWGK